MELGLLGISHKMGGGSGQLAIRVGCICGLGSKFGMFESVVVVVVAFHSEMHQNDVFSSFKNYF